MLFSGADLIRTSGKQAERLDKLKAQELVTQVTSPASSDSSLDSETQGALLRFARFIKKEGDSSKKKTPVKKIARTIPESYAAQIRLTQETQRSGEMLDIYI